MLLVLPRELLYKICLLLEDSSLGRLGAVCTVLGRIAKQFYKWHLEQRDYVVCSLSKKSFPRKKPLKVVLRRSDKFVDLIAQISRILKCNASKVFDRHGRMIVSSSVIEHQEQLYVSEGEDFSWAFSRSLLTYLKKPKKTRVNTYFCGGKKVGKSSLMLRFMIRKEILIQGERQCLVQNLYFNKRQYMMKLLESSELAAEKLRFHKKRELNLFFVVFSLENRESLLEAEKYLQEAKTVSSKFKNNSRVVLVGNKLDLQTNSEEDTHERLLLHDEHYQQTSCANGQGVDDLIFGSLTKLQKIKI